MSRDQPARKGEQTRQRIRTAALRSFRDDGYDATTIRKIAEELGMSVGATNYHFPSKNHLIQELYLDVQEAHRAAAAPLLIDEARLIERLRIVFSTGLDQLTPYHAHAGEFLSAAVSPRSPINPLSTESAEAFAIVEGLFAQAVDGARHPACPTTSARSCPARSSSRTCCSRCIGSTTLPRASGEREACSIGDSSCSDRRR